MLKVRHDLTRLWVGQTISQFGSQVGSAALALTAILVLGASPTQLGLLTALAVLPALLVGLPAGAWVDRMRRRPMMIAADIGRGLLLCSIPAAYVLGLLRIEQLYLVGFLNGVLGVFFNTAYHAALPTLVARENLVQANSKLGMSESLAEIAGPGIGGGLVQIISGPLALLIDALSFFVSALAIWQIRTPERAADRPHNEDMWHEILDGLRFVFGNPTLRPLVGVAVTTNLFGSIIGALYLLYGIRELGLTPVTVGIIIGLGGVGALLGTLIVGRVTRRFGVGRTLLGALLFGATLNLGIPFAAGVWAIPLLVLSQLVGDISGAIYDITETSLRQSLTPDNLLGRANASRSFLIAAAAPVGALFGGALGEAISLRAALGIAVVGILLACLWLVFSTIPRIVGVQQP